MTEEHKKLLARINAYAETTLADIDPQKVQVSRQLNSLRPVLEELAAEKGVSLEEMFILYMDLQSEAACNANQKLQESLQDLNEGIDGASPFLFR